MVEEHILQERLNAATGRKKAEIVFKNIKVADVFNKEWKETDVAVEKGKIVGLGAFEGETVIDGKGKYLSPGFIDGHVHMESSMVAPAELSKVLLSHGVTSIVTDPHEIANVSGTEGIQYMLDATESLPLHVFFMLPSCVPSTEFENSGAVLKAEDLSPFYNHKRVLGLAEVMDFPAVRKGRPDMIEKLLDAINGNKPIDGHAAGLQPEDINTYRTAGISTDHEAVTEEEAKARLERGMWLMIREGSAAKDLTSLIGVVTEKNASRCLFVTDDKHLDDLKRTGSINYNVRLAIKEGIDPVTAISMGSFHAAQCFGLKEKGAVAPGFDADLVLLNDPYKLDIHEVYSSGKLVAKEGEYCGPDPVPHPVPKNLTESVSLKPVTVEDLTIRFKEKEAKAHVIEVRPNAIHTRHVVEKVPVNNGAFISDHMYLKLAVIERHNATGNIGKSIVKGMTFTDGAIASTVAHDSHNLMVCGANDEDMIAAIEQVQHQKGGIAVVKDKASIASIPLSISGLISDQPSHVVMRQIEEVNDALKQIGFTGHFDPLLTLSFLALPVIPELKVTDKGLFDVKQFDFLNIEAIE
ncbi:adenine deaminase [Thalassorhabdus alkalitolerans]|uniref:Adenine deaminase n=1 Tax=Thalassorhabdus alkalitolerans TaxID=2282697 RepID=A0ABW0YR90_9BACI